MVSDWQSVAAWALIGAALLVIALRVRAAFAARNKLGCGGCTGCSTNSASNNEPGRERGFVSVSDVVARNTK